MYDRQFQGKVGTGVPLDQRAIVVVGSSWPDTADKANMHRYTFPIMLPAEVLPNSAGLWHVGEVTYVSPDPTMWRDRKEPMSRYLRLVLAVAIVSIASTAFAGPKAPHRHNIVVGQPRLYPVVPTQPRLDPDDPALTGGGSVGYNRNIYNW